ncbi:MATE family efflux transporter [uncultured Cloacibacillus sp.]|uniref:MATE family efflux transporter n=1 Tax=uncultured Cloacibacillus sp. TaxID=889794 RepID=UPI0025DFBD46|nr:MATE family efflux transporter [uncultured Cloacibacillus sp.]
MKNLPKEVDLGKDPVGPLLLKLAAPAIASQLVNALYNVVDRMYIGHIPETGAVALTGLGVCFPLIMLISAFANLVGMGGAPRASIMMGHGDEKAAERILGCCFAALLALSVALTAFSFAFMRPMLMLFGASEATIGYATDYMEIYAAGTIFVQLTLGMNVFITAQGFSKISMMTVVIGAVTNIVLDPIFIFIFDMGVRGAAWATVISQAISAVWALRFLCGERAVLKLRRANVRLSRAVLAPCLALGFAPFVMQSTESLLVLSFNSSLLKYGGDIAVGAMTIASSVMQFAMLPVQGLTQGSQPIVSYNYGAGNPERMKQAFVLLLKSCLTCTAVIWTFSMLCPGIFVRIFTDDPALTEAARRALRIYMAGMGVFGAQVACQQTFIALGNSRTSSFLAMLRKIILLIPFIYIMPHFFDDKVFAVFFAEPVADVLAVATTVTLFSREFRRLLRSMRERRAGQSAGA